MFYCTFSDAYIRPFPGVIAAVAVLLLCITVLGLQYMFKHKGSYLTNEEDEYESIENTDIELQKDTDLLEAVGEQ